MVYKNIHTNHLGVGSGGICSSVVVRWTAGSQVEQSILHQGMIHSVISLAQVVPSLVQCKIVSKNTTIHFFSLEQNRFKVHVHCISFKFLTVCFSCSLVSTISGWQQTRMDFSYSYQTSQFSTSFSSRSSLCVQLTKSTLSPPFSQSTSCLQTGRHCYAILSVSSQFSCL